MDKIFILFTLIFSLAANASNIPTFEGLIEDASAYENEGKRAEAVKAYTDAYRVKSDELDKLPVLVELVRLTREDKKECLNWVNESEKWLNSHPEKKPDFMPWLNTMRGYVTQNLSPETSPAFMKTWAIDQKLPEFMKQKKFAEAWSLVKTRELSRADLRTQVIHDVLAANATGDKSHSQFCESSLKRYPSSQAWTIRVGQYLQGWKKNKKDPELKKSIISQIRSEEPQSSFISSALENL
jgi:hypothetical protein